LEAPHRITYPQDRHALLLDGRMLEVAISDGDEHAACSSLSRLCAIMARRSLVQAITTWSKGERR
jgi:hypothetical protein